MLKIISRLTGSLIKACNAYLQNELAINRLKLVLPDKEIMTIKRQNKKYTIVRIPTKILPSICKVLMDFTVRYGSIHNIEKNNLTDKPMEYIN